MARKHFRILTPLAVIALIAAFGGGLLVAGPLNPPGGPVTGTYKTLTEVEPRIAINATNTPGDATSLFKITQPGSYYLSGNITGVVGKHGIAIVASGVTLDLSGFDLAGVPAMGSFDGVSSTVSGLSNIAIVNGSVRNWGQDGIDTGSFDSVACRVEGIRVGGNASVGVYAGTNAVVSKCASIGGQWGVFARIGSTVTECSATAASAAGITGDSGSTVSNCSAYANTGSGINGGLGSTISNCSASFNTGSGISSVTGSTVADCTSRANALDGIRVTMSCTVRGNTCNSNGNGGDGAGIHATGDDNRVEGNNCTGADRGIDVDVAGNIILRNTCSGNPTNWDVVAGNVCLVVQGVTGAAILGNTGGAAPGSTDPNANFTY